VDNGIKADEGTRKKNGRHVLYKCTANKWTIGFGRNLEDRGLSEEEAEFLYQNDIKEVLTDCEKFPWYKGLDPVRQGVIQNMVYNLGYTKLALFKETLKFIANKEYSKAATQMLTTKWARDVPNRARRLSEIMRTGVQV